jgi:hypothetical protein
MKDLKMYLRTAKYVKQNNSTTNRSEVKRILQDKAQQNAERRRNLLLLANKSLAAATVFMNGSKRELGQSSDGKTRVTNAFQDLIKQVYVNLRFLGSTPYSEDTIKNTIRSNEGGLYFPEGSDMSEAENEVITLINRRKKQSERTSLNDVKTHFQKKPYGWYPNAIWTITAKLYKRGKIEAKQDANLLEDDGMLNALLNSANYANTILEPQTAIDSGQVKQLRQIYADAFDEICPAQDGKDVATVFKSKLKGLHVEITQLLFRKSDYPFLKSLEGFNDKLARLTNKDYTYYLTNFADFEDDLLDAKDNLITPIKRFMNGEQVGIYDQIRTLLNGDTSNLDYIEGEELGTLKALISNPKPFAGDAIRLAKQAKDTLTEKVLARISNERTDAQTATETAIKKLQDKAEYYMLSSSQQNSILQPLQEELKRIQHSNYIGNLRDVKTKVTDTLLTQQLNVMLRLANPPAPTPAGGVAEPKPQYIKRSSVLANFNKTELQTEADVDAYVESLRIALKAEIKNNRRIEL